MDLPASAPFKFLSHPLSSGAVYSISSAYLQGFASRDWEGGPGYIDIFLTSRERDVPLSLSYNSCFAGEAEDSFHMLSDIT